MSKMFKMLKSNFKPCFGQYEDLDVSWHCLGCPVKGKCKLYSRQLEREG